MIESTAASQSTAVTESTTVRQSTVVRESTAASQSAAVTESTAASESTAVTESSDVRESTVVAELAEERVALSLKRAELAELRASMCEKRMSAMARDVDRILRYANEVTRCLLLVRDAEQREKEESLRCQVFCQEEAWCVAEEKNRRLAAEDHAADVEQYAVHAIERSIDDVRHEAWLRVEADRVLMAKMSERIDELESRCCAVLQHQATGATSVKHRDTARERAVRDEDRLCGQEMEKDDTPAWSAAEVTVVADVLGRSVSTLLSETDDMSTEERRQLTAGDESRDVTGAQQIEAERGRKVRVEDCTRYPESRAIYEPGRLRIAIPAVVMESDRLDPGKSNALSGAVVEAGAGVAMRSYAAILCLPASVSIKDGRRQGNGTSRGIKLTCIRCGSGGHVHERCMAEAKDVKWRIDWRKRRKHRKRWRQVAMKRQEEGMKTTSGVLKGIQDGGTSDGAMLTASRRLRPELKADEDTPGFSKRLQQEQESKEVAQVVAGRLHRVMQLEEVARNDLEEHRDNEDALGRKAGSGGPARPSRTDVVTAT